MQTDDALILFLPVDPAGPLAWVRVSEGRIIARGDDWGFAEAPARVLGVAPAQSTSMITLDLPALAPAQAARAAQMALGDWRSIGPGEQQFVVEPGAGRRRTIWVDAHLLRSWQARLAEAGLHVKAIVAALTIIPLPAAGWVRYRAGPSVCVLGMGGGWSDDDVLTKAMGASDAVMLDDATVEAALIAALDDPPLNLLSGRFGPRSGWSDLASWRWVAGLALAVLLVSALIPLARAYALHRAAARLESEALGYARQADPQAADPLQTLQKGAGSAFSARYAALAAALSAVNGAELSSLTLTPGGVIEARVRVAHQGELSALLTRLSAGGLVVAADPPTQEQGRLSVPLRVMP